MKVISDNPIPQQFACNIEPMNKWKMFKSRISYYKTMLRRKLPYLVWYGQDIDVRVQFMNLRLAPDCTIENLRFEGDMESCYQAESYLKQLGLTFDTGTGLNCRDWEWDWSLHGGIKVAFRNKHKGDREPKEPKPTLRLVPK